MRDPVRIQRILTKLAAKWEAAPDMRLGQLLTCMLADETKITDLFYLEDDRVEVAIEKWDTSGYIYPKTTNENTKRTD